MTAVPVNILIWPGSMLIKLFALIGKVPLFPMPFIAMFVILPLGAVFTVVGLVNALVSFLLGFMRRENEHKADKVACMLGFGDELKRYIASCDVESPFLKTYQHWHPRKSKRIKLIEEWFKDGSTANK